MGIDSNGNDATKADELRRHALDRLRAKKVELAFPRSVGETLRLVQELEIHQIELEMQNEDLRLAQDEVQSLMSRYADLYDFAPVCYFGIDRNGFIREVNIAGAHMLGMEKRLLMGRPFADFIADAGGREIFREHRSQVLRGNGIERCEIRIAGKDGSVIFGLFQSLAMGSPDGHDLYMLCAVLDGTACQQLRDELQSAHDNLELTVIERTEELIRTNAQLVQEIDQRKATESSLQDAYAEIKLMKARLQAENTYLHQEVSRQHNFGELQGHSDLLSQVCSKIKQVAAIDATVLLLGETGTGKGVVARAIHGSSARKDRPLITIDCTTLPPNLIENELFGREKGAFTGADSRQIGRFELADGGTIFLDEIGELPMELQCKLLRVVQDGEFERLGSSRTIKTNVRIISATNRDLEAEVRNGKFRKDLFYRLNVFPITMPPLRQRKEDIPLLVNQFVAKFNTKFSKTIETVPSEALDALLQHHWPGNVRELESVVERAVINSTGVALQVLDRFDPFRPSAEAAGEEVKALGELEYDHILRVLEKTGWRVDGKNGAAVLLGLNPSTLRSKMRKYGLRRHN